jgi:hypothetical protein
MSNWLNLEKDLVNWLSEFSGVKLQFRNSYQAIIGFPSDGFRSDGMLTDGKVLIALEVEAGQMHPDTNVGKYWLLQSENKVYEKIVLFQVFTPKYDSYGWRKKLGEFYARKMGKDIPFEYILIDKRDSLDYEQVLDEVKQILKDRIEKEFSLTK